MPPSNLRWSATTAIGGGTEPSLDICVDDARRRLQVMRSRLSCCSIWLEFEEVTVTPRLSRALKSVGRWQVYARTLPEPDG